MKTVRFKAHSGTASRIFVCLLAAAAIAAPLGAAPTITGIANAASNLPFLPIPQGAIFVIFGSGLGPDAISIAPSPFQKTTLDGTSVAVTVGTTTVNALMYYTSATQVAALLPSNTPTGSANFTVTYNGETSPVVKHGIILHNLGIFTIGSTGQGPAIVTYPDYSLVSADKATPCGGPYTSCGAANPGDTLILWGTGLGAISGDDASGTGLGQNMPDLPLTLWLGGVPAKVTYKGRSGCCIGEDQIVFQVPDNAPTGCAVPLAVQIGNGLSNSTVLPVAKGSRNCTPVNPPLATLDISRAFNASSLRVGEIDIAKGLNDSGTGYQDAASFLFYKLALVPGKQQFALSYFDDQPVGTCIVHPDSQTEDDTPVAGITELDGGSSISLTGPKGNMAVPANHGTTTVISADGTFLTAGSYTVTGNGGNDVGSFSVGITVPATPEMTGPPTSPNITVTRTEGMTVTWQGGDPGRNVDLILSSYVSAQKTFGIVAKCTAPASAGTFTIPPYILAPLPLGNFANFVFRSQGVSVPFTASGLDFGTLHAVIDTAGYAAVIK